MFSFAVSEWGYRDNLMQAIVFELLFIPGRLIAVYTNWFILVPKLLYKNKLIYYVLALLVLIIVSSLLQRFFVLYWGYPNFFPEWTPILVGPFNITVLFQTILLTTSPLAFTTGFQLFQKWFKERNEAEKLKQEKRESELKFLKSQTHPHFLFNTLNSIYGLALNKSDKTPELILKLSNILSYTLYEANTKFVSLEKEIELIENIIDLEKERFGKRVKITFDRKGSFDKYKIPPLILIPLIENAFKHGIKNEVKKGQILIKIAIEEGVFYFVLENSVPESTTNQQKGGLGLNNVSRRLDLLYGENKSFEVFSDSKTFKVELKINLLKGEK